MERKQFAVIGHPMVHTFSPFVHKRLFEIANIAADYNIIDIKSHNLGCSMDILSRLDGYNVTIPHKQSIINFMSQLCERAYAYGAVNVVKSFCTGAVGYNTDGLGFVKSLSCAGLGLSGNIIILGGGGVASAIAHECIAAGCSVTIAVRAGGLEKAETLVKNVRNILGTGSICLDVVDLQVVCDGGISGEVDLLVNATPVGMYPHSQDFIPVDKILTSCRCVFDTIYNPVDTILLQKSKAAGCRTLNGVSMLVWQAVYAHGIWHGYGYSEADVLQLIDDTEKVIIRGIS